MDNYADTSYFNDNQTIRVDPAAGSDAVHKHADSVLNKWKSARSKSQPTEYRVYLRFHATYEDGRKADIGDGWHSFGTVESALTHVADQAIEQLTALVKIGQDDL